MPRRPRVSAVLCTYNRLDPYLPRALASLRAQTLPADRFEIVVVDNASTDGTRAWVAEHHPDVRLVHEPILGVSQARNRGVAEARADLVAFLDDDAIAAPEWLEALVRADDALTDARVGAFGGPIALEWEAPRPAWLPRQATMALAAFDRGAEAHDAKNLIGANVAYRRAALEAVGGFDVRLGRRGFEVLTSGEETLVHQAMRDLGYRLRYLPDMRVRHHAPPHRLTKRYLLRWSWGAGVTGARMRLLRQDPGPLRQLVWAARELQRLPRVGARALRASDAAARFDAVYTAAWRGGLAAEYLRDLSRGSRRR